MLVIEELMLKEGVYFPRVYFDGTKEELRDAIQCGDIIAFTYAPQGRGKELNIAGESIMCYETELGAEGVLGFDPFALEGVQVFLFPTAGFGSFATKSNPTDQMIKDILGYTPKGKKTFVKKQPPFGK